ncbi:protein NRT1/ PTR FAMILY 1.1-like isoform X1 [Nicotiana tabacum]|uniref:Protein NRT1/ PTR FAMILY 1.1-like isoform X1 n=2 Tax=Nicotiana tabacum TaxID=4097 RepID=A0AC58USC2_TOBAC
MEQREMKELIPLHQTIIKMEDHHQQQQKYPHDISLNVPINRRKKGGIITMPFIIANEALESTASYGLLPNMTKYLMKDYRMGITTAQNLLFFWSAATNFLPLIGAFVADSYLGRFVTIGLGCIFSLLYFQVHISSLTLV